MFHEENEKKFKEEEEEKEEKSIEGHVEENEEVLGGETYWWREFNTIKDLENFCSVRRW